MRITFVRPHLTSKPAADALEPLVFAVLARLTPPDVELKLYDARIESIPYDEPTDLVAMTVDTFTAKLAYQIAAKYRQRGVPVIMGGYHPTLVPEEASQFADSIAVGDAELFWPEIVRDAQAKKLKPLYQSHETPSLVGIQPDRSIFKGKHYPELRMVQFGRGCRFACDFCSIHAYYGTNLYRRAVDDVVQEISSLAPNAYVFLVDDNLFVNEKLATDLFQAITPLKKKWVCQISIDVAQNPRLLDLMAKSGCCGVFMGLESLSVENLAQMRKKWTIKHDDYPAALRRFSEHNIMVFGSFVFGYDSDTPDIFDRTLDFAMQSRLTLCHFNPLIATPSTPLYTRLESEGRLRFNRWWLDDAYRYGDMVFHPKGLTPEQITDECFRLRRAFNTYPAMLQRYMTPPALHHSLIYWAANLVSRREIFNKQGQPLGDGSPLPLVA